MDLVQLNFKQITEEDLRFGEVRDEVRGISWGFFRACWCPGNAGTLNSLWIAPFLLSGVKAPPNLYIKGFVWL